MSSMGIYLLVISFFLGAGITGLVKTYALRANLLDVPNPRSSHENSTPTGGGLSIVVLFLGAVTALWFSGALATDAGIAFAFGGTTIAAIGFIDDHRHVSAKWRFLTQVVAATLAVTLLGGLPEFQIGTTVVDMGIGGDVLAIVFMVWFTNAFNFMDGIDGIAATEAVFIAGSGLSLAFISGGARDAILVGVLAAASSGFLVWNWPPAKIFMGDVGSAFLGFMLIAVAIQLSHFGHVSIWSWLILSGVFTVDSTVTLITRMVSHENWLSAHRNHAYQKANRRFGSHTRVTVAAICINVFWLLPAACLGAAYPAHAWILTIVALAPLIGLAIWLGAGCSDTRESM